MIKDARKNGVVRKASWHEGEEKVKLDLFQRIRSLNIHSLLCLLNRRYIRFSSLRFSSVLCGESTNTNLCRGRGPVSHHRHLLRRRWRASYTFPPTILSPTLLRETSLVSDQHKTLFILSLSSFSSAPSSSGSSLLPLLIPT